MDSLSCDGCQMLMIDAGSVVAVASAASAELNELRKDGGRRTAEVGCTKQLINSWR